MGPIFSNMGYMKDFLKGTTHLYFQIDRVINSLFKLVKTMAPGFYLSHLDNLLTTPTVERREERGKEKGAATFPQ